MDLGRSVCWYFVGYSKLAKHCVTGELLYGTFPSGILILDSLKAGTRSVRKVHVLGGVAQFLPEFPPIELAAL